MDPTSLAAAMAGAQMSNVQMAIAAKMLRMNADAASAIVQVLDAAQQNSPIWRMSPPVSDRI